MRERTPAVCWSDTQGLKQISVPPCTDLTCGLPTPSFLLLFWYWQGQSEPPPYYTSNYSNLPSLLLKWCCHCCKLEAELIMNKVNRSQDHILPGITLAWHCSGIEKSTNENPAYLLPGLRIFKCVCRIKLVMSLQLKVKNIMKPREVTFSYHAPKRKKLLKHFHHILCSSRIHNLWWETFQFQCV